MAMVVRVRSSCLIQADILDELERGQMEVEFELALNRCMNEVRSEAYQGEMYHVRQARKTRKKKLSRTGTQKTCRFRGIGFKSMWVR